jgi:hypothetical protein
MQTYGHYEFEELLKNVENLNCFDCGRSPAQWASVNNAIYLCLNCAGEHRGFGVATSYIRSITIDSWNDNQINMMKSGGNKNLRELLEVYTIDIIKVNKSTLYSSRLLDFYRKHLKCKVNKETFDKDYPLKDEALKSLSVDNYNPNSDSTKYSSISKSGVKSHGDKLKSLKSVSSDKEPELDVGFVGALNNWMSNAVNSTKYIANKVGELEIGSKIINTGSVVAETGSSIVNKGTEVAVTFYIIIRKMKKSNPSQLKRIIQLIILLIKCLP